MYCIETVKQVEKFSIKLLVYKLSSEIVHIKVARSISAAAGLVLTDDIALGFSAAVYALALSTYQYIPVQRGREVCRARISPGVALAGTMVRQCTM